MKQLVEQLLAHPLLRELNKPVLYLTAFALAGTLLLAGINAATATRIADNEQQALLKRIEQLLEVRTLKKQTHCL